MRVTRQQLNLAVSQNIISSDQAQALHHFLQNQQQHVPNFNLTHVLYYLGGLVAIGAMTLFMNLGWEAFGGAGVVVISLLYAAVSLKLTNRFDHKQLIIPAGICATFAVCLTPLTIYGLQHWLGLWPDETVYQDYHRYIQWHWFYMELGTLIAGSIIAWKYRYPFLMMPIAVTLWYMTMDISAMLSGGDFDWELRKLVSMYSGLLMIGLALWVDIRSRHSADYAFWIYIFGVIAFWGGLSAQHSDSELSKFFYFCINLLMIFIGVLLVRRVFVVFGAIGGSLYLSHLASSIFSDSWLFPISLTVIGLGIIYLGVIWQKHETALSTRTRALLPKTLTELLDSKN